MMDCEAYARQVRGRTVHGNRSAFGDGYGHLAQRHPMLAPLESAPNGSLVAQQHPIGLLLYVT